MADDGKPKGGANSQSEADATAGAGGKKPRRRPDDNVDKARPRVMRAASEDENEEEDDDEDETTEKARRPTKTDDEEEDEEGDETEKADEEDEDDDDDEDETTAGKGKSSGKSSARAGGDASRKQRSGRAGKRTRKADDALILPAAVKNALLRALSQALERLMAVANEVKEADAPGDQAEASVPDELTEELEDIGELLEDISEQLAEPAEKSRDKKRGAAKQRSAKADVSKAGRRMAKDRLERFQKALELLAAVLKELTNEKPDPAANAGATAKPVGKRELPDVGGLVASVQDLTRVVKQQGEQLGRLQKTRATSNAIPVEGQGRRREVQDVSWPLDMNRPITRDRVDKAISFYDEE